MRANFARKMWLLAAASTILSLVIVSPASAETTSTKTDITRPFEDNECTGEPVEINETLHLITEVTPNPDGSVHVKLYTNTQGAQGTGLLTGDPYEFNEGIRFSGEVDLTAGSSARLSGHEEFLHLSETPTPLQHPAGDDKHVHFDVTVQFNPLNPLDPITTPVISFECR